MFLMLFSSPASCLLVCVEVMVSRMALENFRKCHIGDLGSAKDKETSYPKFVNWSTSDEDMQKHTNKRYFCSKWRWPLTPNLLCQPLVS